MKHNIEEQKTLVPELLKKDWELAQSAIRNGFWIQKGGLGSGGVSINIALETINYLTVRSIIKATEKTEGKPHVFLLT